MHDTSFPLHVPGLLEEADRILRNEYRLSITIQERVTALLEEVSGLCEQMQDDALPLDEFVRISGQVAALNGQVRELENGGQK